MAAFMMSNLLKKKTGIPTPLSMSPIGKVVGKVLDKKKKKRAFEPKSEMTDL